MQVIRFGNPITNLKCETRFVKPPIIQNVYYNIPAYLWYISPSSYVLCIGSLCLVYYIPCIWLLPYAIHILVLVLACTLWYYNIITIYYTSYPVITAAAVQPSIYSDHFFLLVAVSPRRWILMSIACIFIKFSGNSAT